MRGFFVILVLLLSFLSSSAQGWQWLNPLPQGNTLTDLDYLGQDHVISSAGYAGTAVASSDGGDTWTLLGNGEHPFPAQAVYLSPTEGWGIMDYYSPVSDSLQNAIVHTNDGGLSWQVLFHDPLFEVQDIAWPSAQNGWVGGEMDSTYRLALLHTTDGGLTWAAQTFDSVTNSSARVFFLNDQEGWVSVWHWILHTDNGGITWQWYSLPYWMYFDLLFVDSQNGWGASFDEVYRTTDGGQSWTPRNVPVIETEWTKSIALSDADHLWIVTSTDDAHIIDDHVLYSTNGGQTWARRTLNTTSNLSKIIFADSEHGWLCGEDGSLYQTVDGGATWTSRCGDPATDETFYTCVDFADLQHGWIGAYSWSSGSPILRSVDGGASWAVAYQDSTSNWLDIEALSPTNIWAVGSKILHSADGGLTWNEVNLGYGIYQRVICLGDQLIWIASGWDWDVHVHRSTDGGATWETHPVELGLKYNGMAAGDANNVWISGWEDLDEGTVAHSSDGGQTWEMQGDSLGFLDAIYFHDALHGWAYAWMGVVRTDDGGNTWTVASPDTYLWASRIEFLDLQNGFMINYNDAYRTTDGGDSWQFIDPYVDTRLTDISVVDINHAWITGWHGTTLRFDGTTFSSPERRTASPERFVLQPAYPNPFNSVTNLSLEVPVAARAKIEIFDITGRLVQTLADRYYTPGLHTLHFDVGGLPSGVYLARATSGSFHSVQKLVLLR